MIKNLLFDLGGVIMDIKKENCIAAFELLGLQNATEYFGDYSQKGPFMQIEEGAITSEEFFDIIRSHMAPGRHATDEQIAKAFSDFLVGIPPYRLGWLLELRKSYKIYMLSNTNPIMWHGRIAEEFSKCGLKREDYFDGIVTSFEAKSMKPDDGIFRYTIEHLGIDPTETLFLDDSTTNLAASAKFGFHTLHVQAPEQEFMHVLKEHRYTL